MAEYEPKVGECFPQPNKKKEADWHADYKGTILLPDGKTYWIDVWPKYVSKAGNTCVKVKIGAECLPVGAIARPNANTFDDGPKAKGFQDVEGDIPF